MAQVELSGKEMLDRVARAICAARRTCPVKDPCGSCANLARVAIEAMREPTEAMIEAGYDADIPGGRYGEPTFRESSVDKADVTVIWHDMIDAALK